MYGTVYYLATSAPTSAQWTSIGVVAAIILGILGLYYQAGQKATAKSEAESKKRAEIIKPFEDTIAQMRVDQATTIKQMRDDQAALLADQVRVSDAAKEDLRRNMAAQIEQRDDVIETRNRRIEYLEKRVDTLEDQLRNKSS